MREQTISLLRSLTKAHGVTGSEDEVRNIFREYVSGEVITDKLGSIYVRREGTAAEPSIMLSAHLDEVGFVVQSITAEGYIKFISLGGVWGHTVLAQKVRISTGDKREVIGVVSSKPIHFTTEAERAKVIPIEDMCIDIGAKSAEEAAQKYGIQIGQPIAFASDFVNGGDSDIFIAKAFDNRVGVGLVISIANELLRLNHPNTVYCGANSQEEIKGRGAQTAANMVKPDIGIVLEGTPADDFPGSSKDSRQGAMGAGVQIRVMDGSTIMNKNLNKFIMGIAEEMKIPYQITVRRSGGTDASLINLNGMGVPVAVLGVPVRYTHTANSMIDINDYFHCHKLLLETIKRLDSTVYNTFITY
jgi:endoglucanase